MKWIRLWFRSYLGGFELIVHGNETFFNLLFKSGINRGRNAKFEQNYITLFNKSGCREIDLSSPSIHFFNAKKPKNM